MSRTLLLCAAIVTAACTSTPTASGTPTGAVATSSPSPGAGPTTSGTKSPGMPALALREVATGLDAPLYLADAGDAPGRLYVVGQGGRIVVLEDGVPRADPFLDISVRVSAGGERGLLSVAFAPDYADSGRLWVDYTDIDGDTVIERYTRSGDGRTADAGSATVVLQIDQPAANHNGGLLLFGPDGMLWVGTGDGGGGASGNGQRTDTLLGKMLRLDVSGDGYAVPSDNPFVGDPAYRGEIWSIGLRNPWRYSFDRETGDLWIADVGAATWEEVDLQPAGSVGGENYGWAVMEGPDCHIDPCDPGAFVLPVAAYRHGQGDCTIVGGYVYRGAAIPELRGTYLFGDYCSGRVWGLDAAAAAAGAVQAVQLLQTELTISSFGEDRDGEPYVTDLSGGVYQVVRAP